MLVIYFSGTGNTAYAAEMFAEKMGAKCLSIEAEADFGAQIAAHDIIAFCYPIYGSRVPLIMRRFAGKYSQGLQGKKLVVLVTQMAFSGDGARVFTDLFPAGHFDLIYAEHLSMPNNICNFIFRKPSEKKIEKYLRRVEARLDGICRDINAGVVKRRGFSAFARLLGKSQGKSWQGDSSTIDVNAKSMEAKAKSGVKIDADCTVCGACAARCPMKNLEKTDDKIIHKDNCTVCYRCVNLCPTRAITTFIHKKPKWQYKGLGQA